MSEMRGEIIHLSMKRLFIMMAIPGMIGTLILGLYNFVDGIFVGQFIGPGALGGVTLVYSLVLLNQAILTLIGVGSMSLLSIAIGKRDTNTINRILGNLIVTLGGLSLIFSVAVYLNSDGIVRFLGGRGIIFDHGKAYLEILSLGFVFASLGPAINMLFRGEGQIKNAMKILMVGVLLNIILDFMFIYLMKWGVKGAAWATVTSQFVVLILNLAFIARGKSAVSFRRSEFRISFRLMPRILEVGSSTMILLIMASVQQVMLFRSLSAYDEVALVSILGAAYRVLLFAVIPFSGIGQGLQSIVGINYGAGRVDRVKAAYRLFTTRATAFAVLLWIAFMVFPSAFLGMMLPDPDLVDAGVPYFRILFSTFLLTGIINNSATLFQALGKGWKASVIFLARQIIFFIPLLLLLPNYFGISGIWLAMPISEALTILTIVILLISEFRKAEFRVVPVVGKIVSIQN